jgi:hypothetical protein
MIMSACLSYFTEGLSDIYDLVAHLPLRLVLSLCQTVNFNMGHAVLGRDNLTQAMFVNQLQHIALEQVVSAGKMKIKYKIYQEQLWISDNI